MSSYARLEVTPDGELLQSSHAVPADGEIPRPQNTESDPTKTQLYTNQLFPSTAIAALDGPTDGLRIQALYFHPPVQGWERLKLLMPIALMLFTAHILLYTLFTNPALNPSQHLLITFLVLLVGYFLVFYPCAMWFRQIYTQGAPTPAVQRKVRARYPEIPIYTNYQQFLADTQNT